MTCYAQATPWGYFGATLKCKFRPFFAILQEPPPPPVSGHVRLKLLFLRLAFFFKIMLDCIVYKQLRWLMSIID